MLCLDNMMERYCVCTGMCPPQRVLANKTTVNDRVIQKRMNALQIRQILLIKIVNTTKV